MKVFASLLVMIFVFVWFNSSIKNETDRTIATASPESMEKFMFGDLGGINPHTARANALPWGFAKYIFENGAKQLGIISSDQNWKDALMASGFLFPKSVESLSMPLNKEGGEGPAGIAIKEVEIKVPVMKFSYNAMNITCAACHSSPSFNRDGLPDPNNIWLGAPSTSINYTMYTDMLYAGIQYGLQNRWRGLFKSKFKKRSKLSFVESASIDVMISKYFKENQIDCRKNTEVYCEAFKKRYPEYNTKSKVPGVLLPFSPGSPGTTNGVSMLSYYINSLSYTGSTNGFTSVPSFADRSFRSSYLYDGFYMVAQKGEKFRFSEVNVNELPSGVKYDDQMASVVAMFTIPIMGITVEQASSNEVISEVKDVLQLVSQYEKRKFPGQVKVDMAKNGHKIYDRACSTCHGSYKWDDGESYPHLYSFPNKLVNLNEIKTDPERALAYSKDVLTNLIKDTYIGKNIIIKSPEESQRGYVGTLLSELWLSAPYLHNGSVPTLWHLLRPNKRPAKFLTGGHKLDYNKVGVSYMPGSTTAYDSNYKPYSKPVIVDTTKKGYSNKGHEKEFNLIKTEKEKDELLEFLKLI